MIKRISIFIILFLYFLLYSGIKNVGTVSALFLKLGAGARPNAIGGAFTALADDADAIFWNPAGLSLANRMEIKVSQQFLYQGIKATNIRYLHPLGKYGTIGSGIDILMIGGLQETRVNVDGALIDSDNNEVDLDEVASMKSFGTFGSLDIAWTLSYGKRLYDRFFLGANLKFLRQKIYNYSSTGGAFDAGILYNVPIKRWIIINKWPVWTEFVIPTNVGLTFKNIGVVTPFIEESGKLPLVGTLGLNYKLLDDFALHSVNLNIDLNYNYDYSPTMNIGFEYMFKDFAMVRMGFHTDKGDKFLGRVTFGLGYNWNGYQFDYSFQPNDILGLTHQLSVSMDISRVLGINVKKDKGIEEVIIGDYSQIKVLTDDEKVSVRRDMNKALQEKEYDLAINMIQQLINNEHTPELYHKLGIAYLGVGEPSKAADYFKIAAMMKHGKEEEVPLEAKIFVPQKFAELDAKEKVETAEESEGTLSMTDKLEIENLIKIGDKFLRQVKFKGALETYLEALKIDPENIILLNKIGNVYLSQGNVKKANEYFKKAVDLKNKKE